MIPKKGSLIVSGKYRLDEKIGEGSYGEVWRATELGSQTEVAIKIAKRDRLDGRVRFQREIELSRKVDHPHLLKADTLEKSDHENVYLVFPYAEGGSLQDRLDAQGPLSVRDTVALGDALAQGLCYLHDRNIVHRDVHPKNILFKDERIKLTDLGLAQFDSATHYEHNQHPGNPWYRAPETNNPSPLRPSADIYMLGAVLWEALTGKKYYYHSGRPPRSFSKDIPRWLNHLIMRCLSEDAAKRPQDGCELVSLLANHQRLPPSYRFAGLLILSIGFIVVVLGSGGLGSPSISTAEPLPPPTLRAVSATDTPTVFPSSTPTAEEPTLTSTPTTRLNPSPSPSPDPTATATATSISTSTPSPTVHFTRVPDTPVPVATPQRTAPTQGSTHNNPISFSWTGTLYAGQSYQITAYSTRTGYGVQSPVLTASNWAIYLPGEHYGEWKWTVSVVQNDTVVVASDEGQFWFDPDVGDTPEVTPEGPATPIGP